jgi:hypothetical protein
MGDKTNSWFLASPTMKIYFLPHFLLEVNRSRIVFVRGN